MRHRRRPTVPVIDDEADCLASQSRVEFANIAGEQDGAQIEDVPFPAHVARDQSIAFQARQDALAAFRVGRAGQLEIVCMIQEIENVIGADELPGDAGLPSMRTQIVPERLLPFGMVGQTRVAPPIRTYAVLSNSTGALVAAETSSRTNRPSGC